ncbi:MAG: PTS-EIIC domain-containing protein [Candidatus Midichloria mitochondrii]|uniref:Uncharacterized protein n=1 Tax=Midichloria mitochondrii (strain IricVA) TaxID=696127 RepID=F7XWF9_MIDMI|nr:hypothetical protein [Candidatus Midichloria mitochondrii]AEI89008.1 hypothetical protein midi_00714 [Candidatus Midichloria mitochondrii IricVA]MDJ1256737.1 hypothetical protein [Candidatus Midichloria mitochondrii]MDJ1288439.1 hypothetical protein [Candidatus Midichloria mitochondrii]MDJ1299275.1 hypothetical protein [Candidatus Midichloria mitochondrii]MDJ1312795.1 hypothetical protein [Candidatus Midichloria mitochondrii]
MRVETIAKIGNIFNIAGSMVPDTVLVLLPNLLQAYLSTLTTGNNNQGLIN